MSTREDNLMGKSQFLLLNPNTVRAHIEAVAMIGIWKVRISIRARRNHSFHNEAGYMTDALFLFVKDDRFLNSFCPVPCAKRLSSPSNHEMSYSFLPLVHLTVFNCQFLISSFLSAYKLKSPKKLAKR